MGNLPAVTAASGNRPWPGPIASKHPMLILTKAPPRYILSKGQARGADSAGQKVEVRRIDASQDRRANAPRTRTGGVGVQPPLHST